MILAKKASERCNDKEQDELARGKERLLVRHLAILAEETAEAAEWGTIQLHERSNSACLPALACICRWEIVVGPGAQETADQGASPCRWRPGDCTGARQTVGDHRCRHRSGRFE